MGSSCRYSHTFFDTHRIDALLQDAVSECGYQDFRPLIEVEYISNSTGSRMWRVTFRCIISGYQQKTTPQPVVVTAADLNVAFALLETQFAAGSGRPKPPPTTQNGPTGDAHQRSSVCCLLDQLLIGELDLLCIWLDLVCKTLDIDESLSWTLPSTLSPKHLRQCTCPARAVIPVATDTLYSTADSTTIVYLPAIFC